MKNLAERTMNYLKGIGIMFGVIFAVIFGFQRGKIEEKANQNQQILNNVKRAKKIEQDSANLDSDELIDRL